MGTAPRLQEISVLPLQTLQSPLSKSLLPIIKSASHKQIWSPVMTLDKLNHLISMETRLIVNFVIFLTLLIWMWHLNKLSFVAGVLFVMGEDANASEGPENIYHYLLYLPTTVKLISKVLFLPVAMQRYFAKSEAVTFWMTIVELAWPEQSTSARFMKSEPNLRSPPELHRTMVSVPPALILSHFTCCTKPPIS